MSNDAQPFPAHIAIVGGGRWAHVVASVLITIAPPGTKLSLCSPRNVAGWQTWLQERGDNCECECRISLDYEALLADNTLTVVMVIRAARDNAATAIAALKSGKAVFVEKPFALDITSANAVVAAAAHGFCATGLVFLFASNLHIFRNAIEPLGELSQIKITWHDPGGETRYNKAKSYDPSLNCVLDVLPHIWSLLRLLNPVAPLAATSARALAGGRRVQLQLSLGPAAVNVVIERDADRRCRTIDLLGQSGTASIDFTTEPGIAFVNNEAIDVSADYFSPLARELHAASLGNKDPFGLPFYTVQNAVESIELACEMLPAIRRDQCRQIVAGFCSSASMIDCEAAEYALRELVLDRVWNQPVKSQFKKKPLFNERRLCAATLGWLRGQTDTGELPDAIRGDPCFMALKAEFATSS